jgi:methyl-accepting chemotaxis protein
LWQDFFCLSNRIFSFHPHSILQPIRHFAGAIDEISPENLSARIDIVSEDEIGFLAKAFNAMAGNLENRRPL